MKNAKSLLIAAMLGLILIAGQPHSVVALQSTSGSGSSGIRDIFPDAFDAEEQDFFVNITFVGSDLFTAIDPVSPGSNVYEVERSSGIANLRLQANMSGYTCWGCQNTGDGIYTDDVVKPHFGQLFFVVNGKATYLGSGFTGPAGLALTLGEGNNVVTILYAGKDENNGFVYAQDTIIVRVTRDLDTLPDVVEKTLSVDFDLTDQALNKDVIRPAPFAVNYASYYSLDYTFTPTANLNFVYQGAGGDVDIAASNINAIGYSSGDSLSVSGTIDTSGFEGPQSYGYDLSVFPFDYNPSLGYQQVTQGNVFWFDANGLTHLDDLKATGVDAKLWYPAADGESTINTPMGVLLLADYGRWDTNQDVLGASGPDHGGMDGEAYYGNASRTIVVDNIDGRYYYNTSLVAPTPVLQNTYYVNFTMNYDLMDPVEDGNYYYNVSQLSLPYNDTSNYEAPFVDKDSWGFDNVNNVTTIEGSAIVSADIGGSTFYNVTTAMANAYPLNGTWTASYDIGGMTWYDVVLPTLFYNDTVVGYYSYANSTNTDWVVSPTTGSYTYLGAAISSVNYDGMTYYNVTTNTEDVNSIFNAAGPEMIGTIDGLDYWYPFILDSVTVDGDDYHLLSHDLPEPYLNETKVGAIYWSDFVDAFSYDNTDDVIMINGTQVTSIDFEGTTYWSVPVDSTNIFKSTTMPYGTNMDRYYPTVGDSIVNNSITYYAVDFPAPFQNTTVTGNHTEQTPNYQEDIPYFGSFDFTQKSFGFTLASAEYIPGSTTSITQTNSITSTEENSPGFTAVVSMITVGAIAYVAPRMRKKEN
jgi:hypothetical protein